MDHMGHFSAYDVPGLLFAILVASCIGYAVGRAVRDRSGAPMLALWATTAALVTCFVGVQLSLAVIMAALVLLVRPATPRTTSSPAFLITLVLGGACGAGAALIALLVAVPVLVLLRWADKGGATTN